MLAELPRSAFLEWIAYHELEPWSEERADMRSAIVAAVMFNSQRGRGTPARRARDFMAYTGPKRPMAPDKLAAFKTLMRRARGDPDEP